MSEVFEMGCNISVGQNSSKILSSSGPVSHLLNGKSISEKKSNLRESQKRTRADAIIQI